MGFRGRITLTEEILVELSILGPIPGLLFLARKVVMEDTRNFHNTRPQKGKSPIDITSGRGNPQLLLLPAGGKSPITSHL